MQTQIVGSDSISYRAYEGIVYVECPTDTIYQQMNIYIPTAYFEGGSIHGYTASTAPIFLPNNVGGYMPATPICPEADKRNGGKPNATLQALAHGYVVASPGARGRTLQDSISGQYYGKAPAAIIDLKAAVRYLHYNDKFMPGNAQRIVSNGTSAGGALSALLGASGGQTIYLPYLKAMGAAPASDAIFAVSAYCPITDLDHADGAYEWQFGDAHTYQKMEMGGMIDFHAERKLVQGTLTDEQITLSKALSALYPSYVNSLGLRDDKGKALTLASDGSGSFRDYVMSYIAASARKAQQTGTDLSSFTWLKRTGDSITGVDFDGYVQYNQRMKLPPAFDALDLSSGENDLFATANGVSRHFTAYGMEHSTTTAPLASASLIAMMNLHSFISTHTGQPARYWRIRHGVIDKDGSIATPIVLGTRLRNLGYHVDLALPWGIGHSGDYDLDELFAWIDALPH